MLKYLYILLFSLLLPGTLLAQKFVYDVNFKTKQPDNYPLVSCSVKLYDNKANHLIESKNTDAEGSANFKLELKQGLEYRVEFVKEGYSAYKMLIDSKIPDIEKLAKAEYSRKFVIKMEKGNQSASSVGVLRKIKYLSNARDFDDDPSFVPNSDKKKFDQLMVEGEKLLAAKKLDKAKDMFLNALDIYPEDRDALQKIASINAELAKSDNEKQRSLKAMETLNLAKGLLKQNKLPEARMKFQEVLAIDPTNKEAQQQVAEIDKKIGTTAKANTNEQQYKELIDKGDK
ncbi:MAG: hypothetical protein IT239_01085, partial [Bacteroidia bacterium]|nr:hypothetical protein [Bacteroidia bacterium]